MEIPFRLLSKEALTGVIEEFVTREGTDYGHGEPELSRKTAQVLRQLASGRAVVVYDEAAQTCGIVLKEDLKRLP